MKSSKVEISVRQEFKNALPFAYFGAAFLKMASIPLIKHFSLKTIAFSAITVSLGTAFGKREVAHLNFEELSLLNDETEHLFKIGALVICGTAFLFMIQCTPLIYFLPKFTRLAFKDCLILGVVQGLCVVIPLIKDCVQSFNKKPKKSILYETSSEESFRGPFTYEPTHFESDIEVISTRSDESEGSSSSVVILGKTPDQ